MIDWPSDHLTAPFSSFNFRSFRWCDQVSYCLALCHDATFPWRHNTKDVTWSVNHLTAVSGHELNDGRTNKLTAGTNQTDAFFVDVFNWSQMDGLSSFVHYGITFTHTRVQALSGPWTSDLWQIFSFQIDSQHWSTGCEVKMASPMF